MPHTEVGLRRIVCVLPIVQFRWCVVLRRTSVQSHTKKVLNFWTTRVQTASGSKSELKPFQKKLSYFVVRGITNPLSIVMAPTQISFSHGAKLSICRYEKMPDKRK